MCRGGLESLLRLLDPNVVGDVDLGPSLPAPAPVEGNQHVARNILSFFGPATGTTLVSQPVNGQPGLLAFRNHTLYGVFAFKVDAAGRIYDIHGVLDPRQLDFIKVQLER